MTSGQATEATPLRAGARIAGKLELLRVIGEGGMGAVWTARNLTTGGKVALKVLQPGRESDAIAVQRFRYEAKLGATLNHRNITRVFDLVEGDDGTLVLVMELLQGETLRDCYKRKGSLPTRDAVAIMVAVLAALQHAHDHGVVHRDLKPTNIFLHTDSDGQVTPKLLDFGIAKAEESRIETRTGDALGTPQYMSPEQVRAVDLDGRSDLFSVAVVLYEIITGQNPFPGPAATAVLAQVLEQEVDPDPAIDPRVWLELRRSLSKQAYQRHGSAKELAAALCKALGETETGLIRSIQSELPVISEPDPVRAREPDVIEESTERMVAPPRSTSRRPLIAGAGALALVIVLLSIYRLSSSEIFKPSKAAEPTAATLAPTNDPAPSAISTTTNAEPSSTAFTPHVVTPETTGASTRRIRRHPPPPPPKPSASAIGRTPGF